MTTLALPPRAFSTCAHAYVCWLSSSPSDGPNAKNQRAYRFRNTLSQFKRPFMNCARIHG